MDTDSGRPAHSFGERSVTKVKDVAVEICRKNLQHAGDDLSGFAYCDSGDHAVISFPLTPEENTEADVERINQYAFYDLGKSLRKLASYNGDVAPSVAMWDVFEARRVIGELLNGKPMPLGVSKDAALAVGRSIDYINERWYTEVNTENKRIFRFPQATDAKIDGWVWINLSETLSAFETIFAAEMGEATSYFVPRRGIFDTAKLADAADESFPAELRPFIPQKTRDDWREAGRCVAFNLLSASGFHVARAVEGTMESYYQLFSGKAGKTLRSWDDYYKELEKLSKANPTPAPAGKTLAEFDQMRQDYRNPIVHPRVTLSEADARILFNNGESLIIAMASEIKAATQQGGVQPTLGLISGTQSP